ncbi:hypothetical protein Acr_27g0003370 [Actinidia rufa]|uniref:Uncharacterized protein n=1 Tax=Actinidia rufa TaxID=165716 RepID=A0A7J0H6F0_9ERIC|nr:hypothetical protein Acr_27g0003370 [Actinidia rufa]
MTAGKKVQRRVVEYLERTFERWVSGLFIDGVMGRVHGSRRDPRKDKYGKISRRCRRYNWEDCHLESILYLLVSWRRKSRDGRIDRILVEIDQAKYSTSPKGEEEIALWLWASSVEIAWRDSMLNVRLVLPRSRGFRR